jgi:two-component sensor histidine kinase
MAAHARQGLTNAASALDRAATILSDIDPDAVADVRPLRTRLDDLVVGNSAVGTMWATTSDGFTWINNNTDNKLHTDIRQESWYISLKRSPQKFLVGPTGLGTVVKRQRFTLARSIIDRSGAFAGVVVAGVDQGYLSEIYREVRKDSNVVLAALNADGDVLTAMPEPGEEQTAEIRRLIKERLSGRTFDVETNNRFYAARRLDPVPVVLIAATDLEVGMADWRARSIRVVLIGVFASLGFLTLTLLGIRAVTREYRARHALAKANETLEERVKERTQTVELLFRELNHRVKNNLQIIASLLRLQSRKSRDPDLRLSLQDSINRIFAIADVHGEIENVSGGAINLRTYVGKIVSRICDAMRKPEQDIKVHLEVADSEISLDLAVLVAIVINETVTNAFKHAFAHRLCGTIDIGVRQDGTDIVLTVWNDGAGGLKQTDDEPVSSGLGSSIIGMLVQQMAGTLDVDRSEGYRVTIRVPTGLRTGPCSGRATCETLYTAKDQR